MCCTDNRRHFLPEGCTALILSNSSCTEPDSPGCWRHTKPPQTGPAHNKELSTADVFEQCLHQQTWCQSACRHLCASYQCNTGTSRSEQPAVSPPVTGCFSLVDSLYLVGDVIRGDGTSKDVTEKIDHIVPIKINIHLGIFSCTLIYGRVTSVTFFPFFIFFFPPRNSTWQANSSSPLQYYEVKHWPLISQTKAKSYYPQFHQCFYWNTKIRVTCPKALSRTIVENSQLPGLNLSSIPH